MDSPTGTVARSTPTDMAQAMSPMEAAMLRAHEGVNTLHTVLGALEDRLSPVLGADPREQCADTALAVEQATASAIERVQTLLARLEV